MNYRFPELIGFLATLFIAFFLYNQQSRTLLQASASEVIAEESTPDTESLEQDAIMTEDETSDEGTNVAPDTGLDTISKVYQVKKGDTLYRFFIRAIKKMGDVQRIIHLLNQSKVLKKFRAGTEFKVTTIKDGPKSGQVQEVLFYVDKTKILIKRDPQTNDLKLIQKPLTSINRLYQGVVNNSLYYDAQKLGIPDKITHQFARLLSHNVDFQRSMKEGDPFTIFAELFIDPDTDKTVPGKLYYGSIQLKEGKKDLYRYQNEQGIIHYFSSNAKAATRSLLKTPVPGAPISSRFGMRKHPILGYSKMHQGIDFAAPRGTRVLAAGDGIVQKAHFNGGYGNYILLKHSPKIKTAYAHLKRFAKGIRAGSKVKQGQVIGFVGTTGRSTGPHLHYEIHLNNKKVNPNTVKLPTTKQLSASEIKRFQSQRQEIDQMMKTAQKNDQTFITSQQCQNQDSKAS
jgi:murein DD-endopeptidase MepM/ murein hydrolase activator NlpD